MTAFNFVPVGRDHTVTLNWAHVSKMYVDDISGRTVIVLRDGERYETTERKFEIENRIKRSYESRIVRMEDR